jgi:ribonuclease R
MERKAADAERESVKYKQAEYMLEKVGQVFDGLISGVSKYGIFVEVTEVKAEGMVTIDSLKDDYYYLDEDNYQIIGRKYGHIYRLGDKVSVLLRNVDLVKKQMDFVFSK